MRHLVFGVSPAVGDELHRHREDVFFAVPVSRAFADEFVLVHVIGNLQQFFVGGLRAEVRHHFDIGVVFVRDLLYDGVVEDSLDFELNVRILVEGRDVAFAFEESENVVLDGLLGEERRSGAEQQEQGECEFLQIGLFLGV